MDIIVNIKGRELECTEAHYPLIYELRRNYEKVWDGNFGIQEQDLRETTKKRQKKTPSEYRSKRRSPPKHRHDGTSPLPLGMDWSPPPPLNSVLSDHMVDRENRKSINFAKTWLLDCFSNLVYLDLKWKRQCVYCFNLLF
ncbi:hypothetical protein Gotur_001414 [Gossypium turneri]